MFFCRFLAIKKEPLVGLSIGGGWPRPVKDGVPPPNALILALLFNQVKESAIFIYDHHASYFTVFFEQLNYLVFDFFWRIFDAT